MKLASKMLNGHPSNCWPPAITFESFLTENQSSIFPQVKLHAEEMNAQKGSIC